MPLFLRICHHLILVSQVGIFGVVEETALKVYRTLLAVVVNSR
jgi:hypothetical protein